jgi:regulator of sigma E protease
MFKLLSFILVVFPLIIIHEYGHLIVGKILGAKPIKFAIGFGKPLFSKKVGG